MVDISQAPYFDDFDPDKNFHQILFVPARAVQTRELTQIQSMIQHQIRQFGDHVFENGSLVIPGELNYNLEYSFVKVAITGFDTVEDQLANQRVTVDGLTSGVSAQLIEAIDAEDADPVTFYVKYLNGGSTGESDSFADGETLEIKNALGATIANADVISTGFGSSLTINEGVYYVNGFFVKVETQSIILDKYATTPSYRIGFVVNENEVTFNDDPSLLDNAAGTTNFTAPGANRLEIKLDVQKLGIDEDTAVEDNFVEIFRILDGNIQRKARGPDYNILEDVMAQRTFDESGDYTVEPFTIDIREHLNDGTNNGVYLPADGGDESKYVVAVEPGRAYVRGYEVENESTLYVSVDKARETDINNNAVLSAPLGYYIRTVGANILPDISNLGEIQLFDGAVTTPGNQPSGAQIGTANVRAVERNTSSLYFLYVFNIRDMTGDPDSSIIENASSVYAPGTPGFTAEIDAPIGTGPVTTSKLNDAGDRKSIFVLPNRNVKSLLDDGQSDTSFDVVRQLNLVADGSGVVNLPTAGTNEVYAGTQLDTFSVISIPSTSEILTVADKFAIGGVPVGKDATITLGIGYENVDVIVNVIVTKQVATQRSKIPTLRTITGTVDVDGRVYLGRADAYELVSVTENGGVADFTGQFELVENKTLTYYDISYIQLDPRFNDPGVTLDVQYRYFEHGGGDYFSVDSYSSIDYSDIPVEEIDGVEVSMADALDFRSVYANDGSGFIGAGSAVSAYPVPDSTIRADIEYYLSRIDKVFVDYEGIFGVKKGESSTSPSAPSDPDNAMVIYILDVPAYTLDAGNINSTFINNRRYTMRDIGKLEKRIENIEYYTVLNSLEKSTSDQQIIDPQTGLNRFKNGFVADPYIDHSVGDFRRADYACAVSTEFQELRPSFENDVIDMEFRNDLSNGIIEHENLITLQYSEVVYAQQLKASSTMNINPYAVFRWIGGIKLIPNSDVWVDTKYTTPNVTNRTVQNLGNLSQWWRSWVTRWAGANQSGRTFGRRTSGRTTERVNASISTSTRVVGDRVVETEVIPFMRSREVQFQAKGLKPSTRVYCYFDSVDVTPYCKPAGGAYGNAIVTDADGSVNGVFRIPNTSSIRFRTGSKKFVVIDNPDNERQNALAFAEADYSAKGLLETRQQSILSTRTITANQRNRTARRRDPLAQSFYVEQDGGMFVTGVDVYFSSKDETTPVTIQIREMVNGYPGPKILPYSETVLNPSEVNVSSNGTAATTFQFSDPVYLSNETEYCFVLLANSIEYNVYVAGLGEQDIITGDYISKQPFSGVLFKSENNSTWTADQTRDMKFRIKRAEFAANLLADISFTSLAPAELLLNANPFLTTNTSTTVNVEINNHGLFVGSQFTITGSTGGNGIPANELNGTHIVTNVVNNNQVEFEVTTAATDSGTIGGDAVSSDRNVLFDQITPMFEQLNFNGTQTFFAAAGISGQSIDGTEVAYNAITYNNNLAIKDDNQLRAPWVVPSETDNTANNAGNTPFTITGGMSTEMASVSPVIDKNRIGVITSANIINAPDTLDETSETVGGNALARYVTKAIGIKDAADAIKLFIDVARPQSSDVKVYYRIANTVEDVTDSPWIEFDTVIAPSVGDGDEFKEAEFEAESLSSFNAFQVKIVMLSESNARVPRVKNFRAIALGT